MELKPDLPLVSVIVPSYNHANFIVEAIQSVLNQTYQHFELIIIDDCSTDNSAELISKIVDSRIYFEQLNINMGAVDTINYAISKANGQYIALLNSDDVWVSEKLVKQVSFLESNKDIDIVFSNALFINENGDPLGKLDYFKMDQFVQENRTSGEWLRKFFYDFNCLCHPSMLIRKSLYVNHRYNPTLRQLPDFKMWIDLVKSHKLFVMDEKLVKFRILAREQNASASTSENRIRFRNEIYFILNSFFDEVTLSDFKDGFSDLIKYNNELLQDINIIKCEQAFLYFNVENEMSHIYKLIGMQKLYELISDDRTRAILSKYYNFTDKHFFDLTGNYSALIYGENPIINMAKHSGRRSLESIPFLHRMVMRFKYFIKK